MKFERSSGILLHPTSLPGPYGIGDLVPESYTWIKFLVETECSYWQILPLGPTGYGDSPYQCFSAFAGNPFLISPDKLLEIGLLLSADIKSVPNFPEDTVQFGPVIQWKMRLLETAFYRWQHSNHQNNQKSFFDFCTQQRYWLDDYALFMALKQYHNGAPWTKWRKDLRDRDRKAIKEARTKLDIEIQQQIFYQYIFFQQWKDLRDFANNLNVKIIGDIPIFVSHDSADVWSNPELFYLNEDKNPSVVAGVPPDYFSPTGQLWGNPLYNWEVHQQTGYEWWFNRINAVLQSVDVIRLDHFRGFAGYWEIPGDAKTAEKGKWVPGPGIDFFHKLRDRIGKLPLIAEDLGVITPDVISLREKFNLPGMKILQFAFEGKPHDPFLPHNFPGNCIAYTGTHDNDTAWGWYKRVTEESKQFYRDYLNQSGENVAWDMIRAIWGSVAKLAIAPLQDFLDLGNEARMNFPGNPSGNWTWRMSNTAISSHLIQKIKKINYLYSRGR